MWGASGFGKFCVGRDDSPIQIVIDEALTEGGFEPAIAGSGEEAVTLLEGNKGKYRALVTDISLRGTMDGWEVARQARKTDRAFPILYITAGDGDQWASQGVPNSILLTKPFAPAQLVTAISQLLNTGPPTTLKRPRWRFHLAANKKRPQPGGELRPLASGVVPRGLLSRDVRTGSTRR